MSQKHWENYYRSGALSTAPMDADDGFTLELAEAWTSFFEELPRAANVLDIGTGNGVVLAFAAALGARLNREWALHGTDLAQIDPVRDVPQGGQRFLNCRFYPGVSNEALPFENDTFDAVCGHYALEYSDIEGALSELGRVLKPGGISQFIVHHRESVLVRNAHKSLRTADFLLNEAKVYQRLRAFAEVPDAQASVSSQHTVSLRAAIQQTKRTLAGEDDRFDRQLLRVVIDAVGQLLVIRSQQGSACSIKEIAKAEADLRNATKRLKDLVAIARSEDEIQQLVTMAATQGLRCQEATPQVHRGTVLVGWRLRLAALP